LLTQHYIFRMGFNGNIVAPVKDVLKKGGKVLDVGCGTGIWLLEVAEEFPNAKCCGIDMSPIFPTTVKPKNITFLKANMLDGLPFEDDTFDLVHMRLLVMALRVSEWPTVLSEIFRITKPEGHVQLFEATVPIIRGGQYSTMFNEKATSMLALRDQDPMIASKLRRLMDTAGFVNIKQKTISFPLGWYGRLGDMMVDDMRQVVEGMKPLMVKIFSVTDEDVEQMINGMLKEWPAMKSYMNAFAYVGRKPGIASRVKR